MTTNYTPIAEYAHLLRQRKLSATALFDECEARYRRDEPKLNAYKTWNGPAARVQAAAVDHMLDKGLDLGPLMGLPVSVKDLYAVPGMPLYAGSDTELPASAFETGTLIKEVMRQFGTIVGKTHTVEFAFGGLGLNAHWGTPFNPWATDGHRVPGGSSSGAGVSLVQGSALLALGTDTAGSVRIPASLTGLVGLKTTLGRWDTGGIVPLSSSLDTPGMLCRTVEDLVYGFSAIDPFARTNCSVIDEPEHLSGLKIGVPDNFFWDGADPSVVACVEGAISSLARAGATVTRLAVPQCEQVYEIFCKGGLAAPELAAYMQANFPEKIERLDPVVRARVEGAEQISSVEYLRRKAVLKQSGEQAVSIFDDVHVLITPTVAISPPLLSEVASAADYGKANLLALRNTSIGNLFGWCALSMPVGLDGNRMPVGMQLMAPPMQEPRLLGIAALIERHLGNQFQLLGQAPHTR